MRENLAFIYEELVKHQEANFECALEGVSNQECCLISVMPLLSYHLQECANLSYMHRYEIPFC